jgi:hypothetical protein
VSIIIPKNYRHHYRQPTAVAKVAEPNKKINRKADLAGDSPRTGDIGFGG